jgi:TrmH family RNA methyltransferase
MSTLYGMSRITLPELITSPANPLLKDLRRAASRGELTSAGLWIAEGFHLLEEAVRSGCSVPVVLASESAGEAVGHRDGRTLILPDKLFQSISTTETSQGVIALVRPPEWNFQEIFRGQSMVVVLDGIQDPGNAGAIVRAAEAFGATGILFVKGSAGPFHPKTLRASAGSLFRVPFIAGLDPISAVDTLRQHRVDIYAAMPYTGSERLAGDADFRRPCALAIGNEGRGVSNELRSVAEDIAIPTAGVESLNAAVAAAVLLYEIRRQRT